MKLGIRIRAGLNTIEPKSQSPMSDLINDIINELSASSVSSIITPINKIVIVDNQGNERDTIDISSSDWTIDYINHKMSIEKTFVAQSSYYAYKIRLKSDTKIYFEYTLSEVKEVYAGDEIKVTVEISVSFTITGGSGFTGNISRGNDTDIEKRLLEILTGVNTVKRMTFMNLEIYSGTSKLTSLSLNKSVSNNTVTLSASWNPTSDQTFDDLHFRGFYDPETGEYDITIEINFDTDQTAIGGSYNNFTLNITVS